MQKVTAVIPTKVISFERLSSPPEDPTDFQALLEEVGRKPVVLRGLDLGRCVSEWTPDRLLSSEDKDKLVKVHKSVDPRLNFLKKNFTYETVAFGSLVSKCAEDKEYFWYLRSLGEDPRGKDVSDLSKHFPELYKDIRIPPFFCEEDFFSSVFRISSPGLQLWTHYDTCDNILLQIRGRKRVVFFPPSEATRLYLDGDKSRVLDIDEPDWNIYPEFAKATRYEAVLEEGDVLFIPALWFHNITALDFSISVNVFWKNLENELYDKKDTYGNREVIPVQQAFKTFEKATKQLKSLPPAYEDFYLRRMLIDIQKRLKDLSIGSENNQ